ncbi:MAG: hypothetical protein HKN39_00745 [Flavobacteriales bacterium]|nr:hypothetical protein [Flavobacteriales bacterium]
MSTRNYQIIIGVLLLLLIFFGWKAFSNKQQINDQQTEIVDLSTEKETLRADLQDMLDQYNSIAIENDSLNADILKEKERIEELLANVDMLKSTDKNLRWEIDKLKKENGTLRNIMRGYLVQIDSLQQSNILLTEANTEISGQLANVSTEKERLAKEAAAKDNVIKQGSVLQALNLNSVPIRLRNNGNQVETSKASRAEKIKTCCTLYENRIAKSGQKNIYVRIISPDGAVLEDAKSPNATFNFNGVSGKYSAKRVIDYQNQTIEGVCVFYDITSEIMTGLYVVEFYDEDAMIGKTEFELR